MKKTLWTVISCFCLCVCMNGCSTNDHGLDADNPTKITIWNYYNGSQKNAFDKLVSEFNESVGKEKGILVDTISQGGIHELQESLLASAKKEVGAPAMPDMFSSYADMAQMLDTEYGLVNIKDYVNDSEIKEYIDAYIEEGYVQHDNRLLIFPTAKATELLYLNKTAWDAFAQASGVTTDNLTTWEGLVDTAKKYYEYSGGNAFFSRDAAANFILAGSVQLGHPIFTFEEEGIQVDIDKETFRKLWDMYYVPMLEGTFTKNGKYASDDLKTKDVIAIVGSTSSATFFPTAVSQGNIMEDIEAMVLPVPNFADHDAMVIQQGAGIAITKSDETHEYASIVFLRWFTEKERNLLFAGSSSYLPVKKDIDTSILDTQETVKPLVKDTIITALKQIDESTLYTYEAFPGSNEVRSYIENAMTTQAQKDKAVLDMQLVQGTKRSDALQAFTSDAHFDAWFNEFSKQIQAMLSASVQ